eukprot:6207719-Pleurochrysis_carterae.AAC.2
MRVYGRKQTEDGCLEWVNRQGSGKERDKKRVEDEKMSALFLCETRLDADGGAVLKVVQQLAQLADALALARPARAVGSVGRRRIEPKARGILLLGLRTRSRAGQ